MGLESAPDQFTTAADTFRVWRAVVMTVCRDTVWSLLVKVTPHKGDSGRVCRKPDVAGRLEDEGSHFEVCEATRT